MYASVNQVSIGSDNGLSPIRRQAIISNSGLLSIGRLETNFGEILVKTWTFTQENALKIVYTKMAAILPRGRWIKNIINPKKFSQTAQYAAISPGRTWGTVSILRWMFYHTILQDLDCTTLVSRVLQRLSKFLRPLGKIVAKLQNDHVNILIHNFMDLRQKLEIRNLIGYWNGYQGPKPWPNNQFTQLTFFLAQVPEIIAN